MKTLEFGEGVLLLILIILFVLGIWKAFIQRSRRGTYQGSSKGRKGCEEDRKSPGYVG